MPTATIRTDRNNENKIIHSPKICTSFSKAYSNILFQRLLLCSVILYFFAFGLTFISQLIFFHSISWKTILYALYLWMTMNIIMITRLVTATFQREVKSRLLDDIIAIFTKLDHLVLITIYIFSCVFLVQNFFFIFQKQSSYTEMFIYPPKQRYGIQQINPDRLFIIFYGSLLGFAYSVIRIAKQRWVVELEVVQDHPFFLIKVNMRKILKTSMKWSSGIFGLSYFLHILFKGILYHQFVRIFSTYTKVLDAPIVGFQWLDVFLFSKLILVGWIVCSSWEFTDLLADASFSRVDNFTMNYSNTYECLLDGIRFKKDSRIQGFAIAQLVQISSKNNMKRKALYDAIENNYSNSTWFHLKSELISNIDTFRNTIKKEYPVNKSQVQKNIIAKNEEQTKKNADKIIKLTQTEVYKRKKAQPKELDDRTSLLLKDISIKTTDTLPSPDVHLDQVKEQLTNYTTKSKMGITLKNSRIKGPVGIWIETLLQKSLNRRIQIVFNKQNIVIWSIQALGNLLVSSMKEDSYGHIQRDISPILNILLGCLVDIENYVRQPPNDYKYLATTEHDVLLSGPYCVGLALKDAISNIKLTFKDHIQAIKVDDKYLEKWNKIL
ncbi:nucleoporin protein Ndc1-Nup [Cunninghamella echinulata]|nr:nucleoporin protein Ndc1-Nup [Cunninghamella echinulata]